MVLNLSESNTFLPTSSTVNTFDYSTTSTDQRPVVWTSISPTANIKTGLRRSTVTLTSDSKATPARVLSFSYIYNTLANFFMAPQVTFSTGTRANTVGSDPLLSFSTANASGSVTLADSGVSKNGHTASYLPRFEYRRGSLTIEGRFAASIAVNDYLPLGKEGILYQVPLNSLAGSIQGRAVRFAEFRLEDCANVGTRLGRFDQLQEPARSGGHAPRQGLALQWRDQREFPDSAVAGGRVEDRSEVEGGRPRVDQHAGYFQWSYVGPGGGSSGSWTAYEAAYPFNLNNGMKIASISGRNIGFPDQQAIATTFKEHLEYFSLTSNPTNY